MPIRYKRERTRDWRKPDNTIIVSRPAKWGNPHHWVPLVAKGMTEKEAKAHASALFRADLENGRLKLPLEQLRGWNVCCWCGPDDNCHGDVLLDLANR